MGGYGWKRERVAMPGLMDSSTVAEALAAFA